MLNNFKQNLIWIRWKFAVRMLYIFKDSNFLVSITYKQRFFLFIVFSLFRDILVMLVCYLGIYALINMANIKPIYILSLFIFIQMIPDFAESKKTWRWAFFAPDYEWAKSCTPLTEKQLSKLYFMEEMVIKVYGYFTGLVPLTIIISKLCGVSTLLSVILSLVLLVYKIILTFVINRIYGVFVMWFMKRKTLAMSFIKYVLSSTIFIFIGIYIGKHIGKILSNAPFMSDKEVSMDFFKDWFFSMLDELKSMLVIPFKYILADFTPWTYISKQLLKENMIPCFEIFGGILFLLFIVNFILKYFKQGKNGVFDQVINTQVLEKICLYVFGKLNNIVKLDQHLVTRIKLLFRHPLLAEKPFLFLGPMKHWALIGALLGILSIGHLPKLLVQLLIIEIGIVMIKQHVKQLIRILKPVLSYDSDRINTNLYFISPQDYQYLFKIKTSMVRIIIIPSLIISLCILLTTGVFSFSQIILILSLNIMSIWVYPALEMLPGLMSPHFEIKNTQQVGTHSDQVFTAAGITSFDYILHDIIRLIPVASAVGWVPIFIMYPLLIIASIVLFVMVNFVIRKATISFSNRIPSILSNSTN
ncbi:TPA: hypothetical protein ACGXM6_005763 [Bacillus cereus]